MTEISGWLKLNKLEFSPRKTLSLLEAAGRPAEVFRLDQRLLSRIPGLTPANLEKIRQLRDLEMQTEERKMTELQIRLISFEDSDYPPRLKEEVADFPPVLFVRGQLLSQDAQAIAVVGTRAASAYGKVVTERLSGDLARRGLTVVSGLARGVDCVAHQAALDAGGRTIAVFGCGVDLIYPREHRPLAEQIVNRGALVSEFPLSTQPEPWHFPARNRIISGLSLGTLVVEAPENSGALITADFALEQGREVFAVPGNVNTGKSRGCHRLIKEGARLVEDVEDLLHELPIEVLAATKSTGSKEEFPVKGQMTDLEMRIYGVLDYQQRHIDELIRETGLTSAETGSTLMLLEIKGLARRLPGGMFIRLR